MYKIKWGWFIIIFNRNYQSEDSLCCILMKIKHHLTWQIHLDGCCWLIFIRVSEVCCMFAESLKILSPAVISNQNHWFTLDIFVISLPPLASGISQYNCIYFNQNLPMRCNWIHIMIAYGVFLNLTRILPRTKLHRVYSAGLLTAWLGHSAWMMFIHQHNKLILVQVFYGPIAICNFPNLCCFTVH